MMASGRVGVPNIGADGALIVNETLLLVGRMVGVGCDGFL